MGRKAAILWQASSSIAASALFFFFALPRWPELLGQTTHQLGTGLRIVAGVLVAFAALPVLSTLLRTRKPELGTPLLALRLLTLSIIASVLAGLTIVGAAISEIWLSLNTAGQWLFGIYGGAAAVALLGVFAFYLSFVAALPPPPAKPVKPKTAIQRRIRRIAFGVSAAAEEEPEVAEEAEGTEEAATAGADVVEEADIVEETGTEEATPVANTPDAAESPEALPVEPLQRALRNQRPTGKPKTSRRLGNVRGGVAVDD